MATTSIPSTTPHPASPDGRALPTDPAIPDDSRVFDGRSIPDGPERGSVIGRPAVAGAAAMASAVTQSSPGHDAAGDLWVREAARLDAMLEPVSHALLEAAGDVVGDRVLDVGCGTGAHTRLLRDAVGPDGQVTGIDCSPASIAAAAATDDGRITWCCADAATARLDREVDLVTSRFGVMTFDQPAEAFANLRRQLVSGGRLVVAVWRSLAENEWTALPLEIAARYLGPVPTTGRPFRLADPAHVSSLLDRAGFIDVELDRFDHDAWLGHDADDVLGFFGASELGAMLARAAPPVAAAVRDEVRAELRARLGPDGVRVRAASWIVTARRRRCRP